MRLLKGLLHFHYLLSQRIPLSNLGIHVMEIPKAHRLPCAFGFLPCPFCPKPLPPPFLLMSLLEYVCCGHSKFTTFPGSAEFASEKLLRTVYACHVCLGAVGINSIPLHACVFPSHSYLFLFHSFPSCISISKLRLHLTGVHHKLGGATAVLRHALDQSVGHGTTKAHLGDRSLRWSR